LDRPGHTDPATLPWTLRGPAMELITGHGPRRNRTVPIGKRC
jgi:hypothetical protein